MKNDHYLEDGLLWYCLDMNKKYYISLPIHERINFKHSYFYYADKI